MEECNKTVLQIFVYVLRIIIPINDHPVVGRC